MAESLKCYKYKACTSTICGVKWLLFFLWIQPQGHPSHWFLRARQPTIYVHTCTDIFRIPIFESNVDSSDHITCVQSVSPSDVSYNHCLYQTTTLLLVTTIVLYSVTTHPNFTMPQLLCNYPDITLLLTYYCPTKNTLPTEEVLSAWVSVTVNNHLHMFLQQCWVIIILATLALLHLLCMSHILQAGITFHTLSVQ